MDPCKVTQVIQNRRLSKNILMKQNKDDRSVLTTKTNFPPTEVTGMLQELKNWSYFFRKQKNYLPSVRSFFRVSYSNFL